MIFQGIRTSIANEPYIFVIFQGGGGGGGGVWTPCPAPLWIRAWNYSLKKKGICNILFIFGANQATHSLTRSIWHLSRDMRFPTMWYVRPAKAQTSLCICAVWSEPLLVAWIFYDCYATCTDQTAFGVSKLKRRLHRITWVYTCQNATLLEITCRGSFFKFCCCFNSFLAGGYFLLFVDNLCKQFGQRSDPRL